MLEQSDIAHYLLSAGLVKAEDVIEEDLAIVDVSRRNRVFLVTRRVGPTYVIKQPVPRSAETLAHEVAVLHALAGHPQLADHVPAVEVDDPVVLRTPGGAQDWNEHHGSGQVSRSQPAMLARILAALHRLPSADVEELPGGPGRMWGLSLAEPPHELVLDLSAGAQDLLARIQGSRALCARLAEVREQCSETELVHGDLRWDNCLAVAAPGGVGRPSVMLIDWELAGSGAAAYDVGTMLAEYLRVWIGSIAIVDPKQPGLLAEHAKHPLERMLPAIHAFWSGYKLANPGHPALARVMELTGVRLLQTALERAQDQATASAHEITLVQLASNMLDDPLAVARELLEIQG